MKVQFKLLLILRNNITRNKDNFLVRRLSCRITAHFGLDLESIHFYNVSSVMVNVRAWVVFLGRASVRVEIKDKKPMSRDNFL